MCGWFSVLIQRRKRGGAFSGRWGPKEEEGIEYDTIKLHGLLISCCVCVCGCVKGRQKAKEGGIVWIDGRMMYKTAWVFHVRVRKNHKTNGVCMKRDTLCRARKEAGGCVYQATYRYNQTLGGEQGETCGCVCIRTPCKRKQRIGKTKWIHLACFVLFLLFSCCRFSVCQILRLLPQYITQNEGGRATTRQPALVSFVSPTSSPSHYTRHLSPKTRANPYHSLTIPTLPHRNQSIPVSLCLKAPRGS